jgi:hypothetical protein
VQYDHGTPLPTEEHTQQQVTTHHRGILRAEDSGLGWFAGPGPLLVLCCIRLIF